MPNLPIVMIVDPNVTSSTSKAKRIKQDSLAYLRAQAMAAGRLKV